MARTSIVIALATSVALVGSGCAHRGGSGMLVGAGAVVATLGVSVYASAEPVRQGDGDPYDFDLDLTAPPGKGLIGLGLVLMGVGVIGVAQPDNTANDVTARSSVELSQLDRLAMRAVHAARASDCATARQNVAAIRSMDGDYAVMLVAREPLINGCVNS